MMRKYILTLMILGLASSAHAAYLFRNSASNINSGTLNSARLDPSSVTMRGGEWSQGVDASTTNLANIISADTTTVLNLLKSTAVAASSNLTAITAATTTLRLNLDASTTSITAAIPVPFNLVVGTAPMFGVQAVVSTQETFNAIMASVSARGLTTSATAQATIFFRDGIYKVQGTTVPRGITLVCGSSVVFVQTSLNDRLMTIHGTVIGAKFDIGRKAFGQSQVVVSTFGKLLNSEIYGGLAQLGGGISFRACLHVGPGFDMEVKNNIVRELQATDGVAYYGDVAPILLKDCTGFKFTDNTLSWIAQESANSTSFTIWGATRGFITGNKFQGMVANGIAFNTGVRDILFTDNDIEVTGNAPDHGVFTFSATGNSGAIVSSGVYITNNIIQLNTTNSWNVFRVGAVFAAEQVMGLVVSGNIIDGVSGSGMTFANLSSGSLGTVFTNNHIMTHGPLGTFLTDSGAGTKSASLGNFLNHIEQ